MVGLECSLSIIPVYGRLVSRCISHSAEEGVTPIEFDVEQMTGTGINKCLYDAD
jgi:hypothetical protein